MSGPVILFQFWKSSCSWRVRAALELKQLSYQVATIDLFHNEQFEDDFKAVNPHCQVPALFIDNRTLSQSLPICEYLEETRGGHGKALLPKHVYHRFQCRHICEIINSQIQPMQALSLQNTIENMFLKNNIINDIHTNNNNNNNGNNGDSNSNNNSNSDNIEKNIKKQEYIDNKKKEWVIHNIENGFNIIENLVLNYSHSKEYCIQQDLSLADVFLIPQMQHAQDVWNIDLKQWPNLFNIYENVNKLPEFIETHPLKQPGAPGNDYSENVTGTTNTQPNMKNINDNTQNTPTK